MKISFCLLCLCALLILSGCGSNSNTSEPGLLPQQRQEQLKNDNSIPVPAQQRVDEQIANKKEMDAMRAKDAANSPATP